MNDRRRRIRGIGSAWAVLALFAAGACDRGEPGALPDRGPPVDVAVSAVVESDAARSFPASVRALENARLATRTSGTIERIEVNVGSSVRRGQTVAVLDDSDVRARVRQAEAAARRARRAHERMAALAGDGAATEQELDDALAARETAEAALAEARSQLAYVVLRAPFDGVVTARMAEPGDLAVPGQPVLEIAGTDALEVVADLPADLRAELVVGDSARVLLPLAGGSLPARIVHVSPALDVSTRRFRVEAELSASVESKIAAADEGSRSIRSELRPGAFVRLELPSGDALTRWMPLDALVRRGQLTGAFVPVADTLRLRWVRTGLRAGDAVEVLAGLEPGARVVRAPAPDLADGRAVGTVRTIPWTLGGGPIPSRPSEGAAGDRPTASSGGTPSTGDPAATGPGASR